jgi:hypothetical protein
MAEEHPGADEESALGYPLVIQLGTLTALIGEMGKVFAELQETGRISLSDRQAPSIDEIASTLGLAHYREAEEAALAGR